MAAPSRASSQAESSQAGIGQRIKAARVAAGMTQEMLAAAVGVSRSAVAQWETERAGQVGANLARVAAALGVSTGHLLSGEAGRDGGSLAESGPEMALLRLYRSLSESDRAYLLRLALLMSRQGG
jgi:transcriptional regulator with XRE-family HTH domain